MDDFKNKITLADCKDIMRLMPDKLVDLAIVDPPYGIDECMYRDKFETKLVPAKKYNTAVFKQQKPDQEYFNELMRISKNQIIWGGNYFADMLPSSRCWIVWKKNTSGVFADAELAWTSFNSSVRVFEFTWNGMIQGYGGNKKKNEIRIHPTQKPVALYRWLLNNYGKPGDLILDTHSGSGSCAIGCHLEGFDFIAIEKDKDYWTDSIKRYDTECAQLKLFNVV